MKRFARRLALRSSIAALRLQARPQRAPKRSPEEIVAREQAIDTAYFERTGKVRRSWGPYEKYRIPQK